MAERPTNNLEASGKLRAEFSGFSPEQEARVRKHIESIGLPVDNISKVSYKPAIRGEVNVLGSFQPAGGTLTLHKSLDNLPPVAQHATIVHELAHSASPFDPGNEKLYTSAAAQEEARTHTVAVARQSIIARKYLNGYQTYLHKQLESGEIDIQRFVEETHGILIELRFTNPKHLKQVEDAQITELARIKKSSPETDIKPVNIITSELEAQQGKVSGVDRTIVSLIPQINSKAKIDAHVANLKAAITKDGKPLLPIVRLAQAA